MGRREDARARGDAAAQAARADLDQWRQAHPTATFNEIEDAVDARLDGLRAQAITDLALASRAADLADKQAGAPPRCNRCGRRLTRHGRQRRTVVVPGGQAVDLPRDYARCPACQTGLFPPG